MPAGVVPDRLVDPPEVRAEIEIGGDAQLLLLRRFGKGEGEPEVLLELRPEGNVAADLFTPKRDAKLALDVGSVEFDGHQQERRRPLGVAGRAFVPRQHPEGEVERVDALFLDGASGPVKGVQKSFLEGGRPVGRLQLCVDVPVRGSVAVARVVLRCVLGLFEKETEVLVVLQIAQFLLLLFAQGEEGHASVLPHEDSKDLRRAFIDDLHAPAFQRAVADQRVAEGEVEQFVLASAFELIGDGGHGVCSGGSIQRSADGRVRRERGLRGRPAHLRRSGPNQQRPVLLIQSQAPRQKPLLERENR